MRETDQAYDCIKANRYDKESKVIRGNREYHRTILSDLLIYIKSKQLNPKTFVDLGCGTGDLTEMFFQIFPEITGYLFDGSEEMLNKAKSRFTDRPGLIFQTSKFEELDWQVVEKSEIVFSSFAIHHLQDGQKWNLFQDVYENLNSGGVFILFDYFRPEDKKSDALLEFISCMDIKRRAKEIMRMDVPMDQIIQRDRAAKEAEGDKEASLTQHFDHLKKIGFNNVTMVFKESRLAGLIAFKD